MSKKAKREESAGNVVMKGSSAVKEKEKEEEKEDGSGDAEEGKKGTESADKKKDKEKEKRGLTGKHVALILGIVLILAAAAVIIVYLLTRGADIIEVSVQPPSGNMVVDEDNVMNIRDMLREQIDRGLFTTYMTSTWTFPDGNSPSTDAVMGNSEHNKFPFWFTVKLYGTEEVVFTSTLLPVGSQLAEIKLDTPLPQGRYNAEIDINMIDLDGFPVENNIGLGITLVVLN